MEKAKVVGRFLSRNVIGVGCLGFIVVTHWAWYRLQFVDEVVPENERKPLPHYKLYQNVKKQFFGESAES